jgi:hypothetical protein
VVYEINTNPEIHPLEPQRSSIRDQTLRFARERMAQELWRLDSGNGAPVPLRASERLKKFHRWNAATGLTNVRP